LLTHRLVLAAFVFRHFFDGLALAGAVAEWSLACWLLGIVPSPVWHVVVPLTLAVVIMKGARSPIAIACAAITVFVFWTHRANIGRLRRGEENRVRRARPAT